MRPIELYHLFSKSHYVCFCCNPELEGWTRTEKTSHEHFLEPQWTWFLFVPYSYDVLYFKPKV